MDSITQALLGAALQGSLLGRIQGRRALVYGAVLATVPDLDVFVHYADPVSQMTYHRGFSHSLFVLTALGLALSTLVTALARWRWPDHGYRWPRLMLTFWLVLVTHPLLDAFTVYGTQLLWPLQVTPQSWAGVFIIDPLYSVPLLLTVVYAGVRGVGEGARRWLAAALVFSTLYLGCGIAGRLVSEQRFAAALDAQGIAHSHVRAVPMAFNTLLWRVMAKTPDGHYYEGVSSLLDTAPPEMQRQALHLDAAQPLAGVPLHERLRWFTGDWLRYDIIGDALVVSDLRMGMPSDYNFRFLMARRDAQGQWQPVQPSRWPGNSARAMFDRQMLGLLWQRIFDQRPPLPLAAWQVQSLGKDAALQR
ncbi:metal-dependent hydrolase [Pseudomonas sp. RP23018S]|uniref:metal-dependent hydrolase n=1 Tax=Pseudomonas sp. RP23018S TaxID=3096037 RepID=UPI002ACA2BAE|nr:metal-dependent hydrolase [Pseudomonas sp. RP23018S]MDZ5602696.1 metal-dependent hydrolase [Pseudomonas sp. RP23018S]